MLELSVERSILRVDGGYPLRRIQDLIFRCIKRCPPDKEAKVTKARKCEQCAQRANLERRCCSAGAAPAPTSETGNKINSTREGAFHRRRRHMHDYKARLTHSLSLSQRRGGRGRASSFHIHNGRATTMVIARCPLAHCDSYGSWSGVRRPSALFACCFA